MEPSPEPRVEQERGAGAGKEGSSVVGMVHIEESELLVKRIVGESEEEDDDDVCLVRDDVEAMMAVCCQMARNAMTAEAAFANEGNTTGAAAAEQEQEEAKEAKEQEAEAAPPNGPTEQLVGEFVVAEMDENKPSWVEQKIGPWAARHQYALRVWLLALLTLYVALFVSMLLQDGLRGLSERTPAATVRDLLWAVLMGLIVVLAIGKNY